MFGKSGNATPATPVASDKKETKNDKVRKQKFTIETDGIDGDREIKVIIKGNQDEESDDNEE